MAISVRRARFFVAAMLSALVVASCGGGGGGGENAAPAPVVSDDGTGSDGNSTPADNQRPDPTPPSDDEQGDPPPDPSGPGADPVIDLPPPDDGAAELYEPDIGAEAEATPVVLTLHDPARGKDLDMRISWPVLGSNLPVIIFSHGYSGSMLNYDPLITQWVSHGYVTIQPNHGDSYLIAEEDRASYEDWRDRVFDIVFVLDSLDQISASIPALAGKMDRGRIVVAGHSFGAQTAQLVGGAIMLRNETLFDSRIGAVLLISPQGVGEMLDEDSWAAFTNPLMVITGTNDIGDRTDDPWTWRTEPYLYAPSGSKHLVVIDGAYHNFGGISGYVDPDNGPPNATHVMYVQSASTAFLDAYAGAKPAAQAYLASEDMEEATANQIDYQYK